MRLLAALATLAALHPSPAFPAGGLSARAVIEAEWIESAVPSPDGRLAAWLSIRPDLAEDRARATLFVTDLGTGASRALDLGGLEPSDVAFAPDGASIGFLSPPDPDSDSSAPLQLYEVQTAGGAPRARTDLEDGVLGFLFLAPERLVLLARDRRPCPLPVSEDLADAAVAVEDPAEYAAFAERLFEVPARGAAPVRELPQRPLVPSVGAIDLAVASPDGRFLLTGDLERARWRIGEPTPYRVWLDDLATGRRRLLYEGGRAPLTAWFAPDGDTLYALVPRASIPDAAAYVLEVDAVATESGAVEHVPLDWDRGVAEEAGLAPVAGGFLALLRDGLVNRVAFFARTGDGWRRTLLEHAGPGGAFGLCSGASGDTVILCSGSSAVPDRYAAVRWHDGRLGGAVPLRRAAAPEFPFALAPAEILRWPGAGGDEVEGLLYRPAAPAPADPPPPLVVLLHGGPHAAVVDRFQDDWAAAPHVFAAAGALVLAPNYHGSEGYGLAFAESIRGRPLELEIEDVRSAVRALAASGTADPARVALAGWSWGGIVAAAATAAGSAVAADGSGPPFAAAAVGAADVLLHAHVGTSMGGPLFLRAYFPRWPWQAPELYQAGSALFRAAAVATPTILFAPEQDEVIAASQSWLWYRALQQEGKVAVRFLLFPDEGHSLSRPRAQLRKLEEELAWFRTYLDSPRGAGGK